MPLLALLQDDSIRETIQHTTRDGIRVATQSGIGLGAAIAVVCSWERNKSILFAILAGVLGWLYVLYFAVTREEDEVK